MLLGDFVAGLLADVFVGVSRCDHGVMLAAGDAVVVILAAAVYADASNAELVIGAAAGFLVAGPAEKAFRWSFWRPAQQPWQTSTVQATHGAVTDSTCDRLQKTIEKDKEQYGTSRRAMLNAINRQAGRAAALKINAGTHFMGKLRESDALPKITVSTASCQMIVSRIPISDLNCRCLRLRASPRSSPGFPTCAVVHGAILEQAIRPDQALAAPARNHLACAAFHGFDNLACDFGGRDGRRVVPGGRFLVAKRVRVEVTLRRAWTDQQQVNPRTAQLSDLFGWAAQTCFHAQRFVGHHR